MQTDPVRDEKEKEGEPPKSKQAKTQKKGAAPIMGPHGTKIKDFGGSGECGWLAMAGAYAIRHKKKLEKVTAQANTLRVQVYHRAGRCSNWHKLFAPVAPNRV